MLERMHVLGVLAASDMSTGQAEAQLVPRRADRHAIDAAVARRPDLADLAEMLAGFDHLQSCSTGRSLDKSSNALEKRGASERRWRSSPSGWSTLVIDATEIRPFEIGLDLRASALVDDFAPHRAAGIGQAVARRMELAPY